MVHLSKAFIAIVIVCATAARVDPPKFPVSWTAMEAEEIAIAQGTTKGPNGEICCAVDATQCQAQVQSEVGTHYYDGVGNQTRFDDKTGSIVITQFTIGKEMSVSPNLTCIEYCPTQFDFDPSPFWPTPGDHERIFDLGKKLVNGVECDHYQWIEHILGVVKMQQTDMYIEPANATSNGSKTEYAVPVWEHDIIEPFGQKLGTEDTHWTQFTPGQPDASLFKVVGIANCKMSPNCGNDNSFHARRLVRKQSIRKIQALSTMSSNAEK